MDKIKKICPLKFPNPEANNMMGCIQRGCAWWDIWNKRCAMLTITHSQIKEHLVAIGEGWECENCKHYEGDSSWGKCLLSNNTVPSFSKCGKWEYPNEQD